jgi:hypothetical protein
MLNDSKTVFWIVCRVCGCGGFFTRSTSSTAIFFLRIACSFIRIYWISITIKKRSNTVSSSTYDKPSDYSCGAYTSTSPIPNTAPMIPPSPPLSAFILIFIIQIY